LIPTDLLSVERIQLDLEAVSKKRVLEEIATLLQGGDSDELNLVFDQLFERERLGGTGLGHGVALPHARLSGLRQSRGAFLRLAAGIDYDANDGEAVDLVFGLLVPEQATDEHLQLLASLAMLFRNDSVCQRLRAASDPLEILQTLRNA
jgi:nitrogen PTS system EIIA component